MYARATLLEIDTVRVGMDAALEAFREGVLPRLQEQPGYEGVLVMESAEGKGLIVTFWSTPEAADTEGDSFYAAVLAEHMTLFRSPPGRERYEVALADLPANAAA